MSAPVPVSPPMHFRPEDGAGAGSIGAALLVAVLLLALMTVALAWAKRKGWLKQWTGNGDAAPSALRVRSRLRLSPRTVVYEVETEQGRLHVIESSVRIGIHRGTP